MPGVRLMDWMKRVASLADQFSAAGKLTSPAWRAEFCAVPRHELVPEIYLQDENRRWCPIEAGSAQWRDLVYSDTTVITAVLPSPRGVSWPVSSSTKPGLMLRMLEALDVHDGMRVLEIGTGSGYNAALLCARLGGENVFSVDLRSALVELARDRLARLGYRPTLAVRDGSEGLAAYAPYDRIIVTCGMPFIPTPWITQLAPGGLLLVDLEGPLSAGNLIALRRHGEVEQLSGRFLPWFGRFLPMRRDVTAADHHLPSPEPDITAPVDTDWTTVDPAELDGEFRLLAQLHLPSGTFHSLTAPAGQPRPPIPVSSAPTVPGVRSLASLAPIAGTCCTKPGSSDCGTSCRPPTGSGGYWVSRSGLASASQSLPPAGRCGSTILTKAHTSGPCGPRSASTVRSTRGGQLSSDATERVHRDRVADLAGIGPPQ